MNVLCMTFFLKHAVDSNGVFNKLCASRIDMIICISNFSAGSTQSDKFQS